CILKRKRAKFEEKQQGYFNPGPHYNAPLPIHDCTGFMSSLMNDKAQKHVRTLNWNRSKKDSCVRITGAGISKDSFNTNKCKDSSSTFLPGGYSINTSLHSNLPLHASTLGEMAQVSLLDVHKSLPVPEKSSLKDKSDADTTPTVDKFFPCSADNHESLTAGVAKSCSASEFPTKFRKHGRLFSWQRHRKRKKVNTLDGDLNCHASIYNDKDSSSRMLEKRSVINLHHKYAGGVRKIIHTQDNQVSELVNQYPAIIFEGNPLREKINNGEAIDRDNSEKYHSLLRMLKTLIRNAHKCHHMEFLRRHCSVPHKCCRDDRENKSEAAKGFSKNLGEKHVLQKSSENPLSDVSSWKMDVNKQKAVHKKCSMECDFQSDQSGSYCQPEKVVSFVWAATRSIVPVDLLGDASNWRSLRRNISKFVRLQRFEKFYLRQCINKLQISSMSFLSRLPNHHTCHCSDSDGSSKIKETSKCKNYSLVMKHKLFRSWIYWFFSDMIVPMLGANFYITERESGRHEVFYYTKPVWCKLVRRTITSLKEQNYRHRAITYTKLQKHNTRVKLVPLKSVNSALYDMHAILKRIKTECPQMLGASVFDYNDIYQILCEFLSRLRNGSTTIPEVFIVVCDVSKAFDSIDQERLLDVMKDVLQKEEYHVRKYAQVICSRELMRVLYGRVCVNQSKASDIMNSFSSIRSRSSHGVLVGQGIGRRIKLVEIRRLLHEHVKSNMLQLGQEFYLQKSGIAQGSLLSSLLCSFYYGHLERTIIFPFLGKIHDSPSVKDSKELDVNRRQQADCRCSTSSLVKQCKTCLEESKTIGSVKEVKDNMWRNKWQANDCGRKNGAAYEFSPMSNYLLLRLIDDFIFISTSKRQATCFFNRLCRGFREYNCYMNSEKFGLSFDVDGQPQVMQNRRYVGADGVPFLPWSGLLVNCCTLEVQADYTRRYKFIYLKFFFLELDLQVICHCANFPHFLWSRYLGTHLRSTLTVHAQTKQEHLGEKLCSYMRPKCHPIFYDSYINSPATVRLNLYQAFLLCAMKFHCYLCAITPHVRDIGPAYCLNIIQKSFRYMYRLIKKRMYGMERGAPDIRPVLKLKKPETIWLGLSAYIRVLGKKQSRHAELLSLLKSDFCNLGRMDCDPSPLKYAVDDSHSSMFWKIKY
ncbi:hypothetical protein Taro_044383, partial [Colocasia esculenta]|nr:hypothetical protein [Colocasia esculenta]